MTATPVIAVQPITAKPPSPSVLPNPAPGAPVASPTLAADPTVASLYGPNNQDSNPDTAASDATKIAEGEGATEDANQTKSNADILAQYQTQLDGLNTAAAQARAGITASFKPDQDADARLAAAKSGGAESLAASRGLAGGSFGDALITGAAQDNADAAATTSGKISSALTASDQDYAKQTEALNEFIQGEADKEATTRDAASKTGADAKIAEINGRPARAQTAAQAGVSQMYSSGITDPSNPNYNDGISKIAASTGLSAAQVSALFTANKTTQDTNAANLDKTKSETAAIPVDEAEKEKMDSATIKNQADTLQEKYAELAETKAENTLNSDEVAAFSKTLPSYNGQSYITTTQLAGYTAKQKSVLTQAAAAAGTPVLTPANQSSLESTSAAKDTLGQFSDFLATGDNGQSVLPQNWTDQPAQYANVKLNSILSTNGQLSAFNSWLAQVPTLLSALKGPGTGGAGSARLFATIGNMLPNDTDTLGQATDKINTINKILDSNASAILGTNSSQDNSNSPQSSTAPTPITAPDGTQVIITD